MAASHSFKIFNSAGQYVASAIDMITSAQVVAALGVGHSVRFGHSSKWTLWKEGKEFVGENMQPAAESFDYAAHLMAERLTDLQQEAWAKAHGKRVNAANA